MIPWAPAKKLLATTWVKTLTSIVAGSERVESLLTCSIPNLQLDDVVLMLDCFQFEVNTDSVEKVLVELIISIS